MEIVECIKKNDMYIQVKDEKAYNPETDIALIKDGSTPFEFAYNIGFIKMYNKVETWKLLYPDTNYSEAWQYVKEIKGTITSNDTNFEEVMTDENLTGILGNIRINRLNFEIKTLTNGKNCEPCEC